MARNGRPKVQLALSQQEQEALRRLVGERPGGRAASLRARVILACGEGRNNRDVARTFDLAEHTVGKWRRRFVEHRLEGLRDRRARPNATARLRRRSGLRELAQWLTQGAPFGPWSLGQALRAAAGPRPLPALAN